MKKIKLDYIPCACNDIECGVLKFIYDDYNAYKSPIFICTSKYDDLHTEMNGNIEHWRRGLYLFLLKIKNIETRNKFYAVVDFLLSIYNFILKFIKFPFRKVRNIYYYFISKTLNAHIDVEFGEKEMKKMKKWFPEFEFKYYDDVDLYEVDSDIEMYKSDLNIGQRINLMLTGYLTAGAIFYEYPNDIKKTFMIGDR